MKVDHGKLWHLCDDPVCPDPVWKLSVYLDVLRPVFVIQPLSYSRFRRFQSRVWTILKLVAVLRGLKHDAEIYLFEIETLES